jgi:uncharacterized ion transporter superfamily protein YfcC
MTEQQTSILIRIVLTIVFLAGLFIFFKLFYAKRSKKGSDKIELLNFDEQSRRNQKSRRRFATKKRK